jgi:hypothetical protein
MDYGGAVAIRNTASRRMFCREKREEDTEEEDDPALRP